MGVLTTFYILGFQSDYLVKTSMIWFPAALQAQSKALWKIICAAIA